jgi:NAD+ synthase (glutamine-hydrolysing)
VTGVVEYLLDPFQYQFFIKGLVAALLAGGLCGLIGVYITLRGMSYIGHGLSHAIFGGAVASYILGINVFIGAGVWGLVAALFINRVARRRSIGADAAIGALLACAYQPTENSGKVTRHAAEQIALAIGAEFHVIDVDALYQGYVAAVEQAIGRKLTWATDDLTLQNLQARVRAPSIWALANVRGAVLLTTSNRSEAAVGYATMDGDTAGGLAPLGGIDKLYLRSWLRWMETKAPLGTEPIPALRFVNAQQPTAELRPPIAGANAQTDEADLMPYDFLEAVEDSAIRDKHTPVEVLQELSPRYPQHSPLQLATWIERFFRLWCKNQWKRERFAPSLHLDDRNVDPRSWCRFPILSGGFERELAELRAYVASGSADR